MVAVASALDEIDQKLSTAIAEIGGGWEGVAAEAAVSGLTPLSRWAGEASASARSTAQALATQADLAGDLRFRMPEPADLQWRRIWDKLRSLKWSQVGLRDILEAAAAEVDEEERAQQARELMYQYTWSSDQNQWGMRFWTEPPAVAADSGPASAGGGGPSPDGARGPGGAGAPSVAPAAAPAAPTAPAGHAGEGSVPAGGAGPMPGGTGSAPAPPTTRVPMEAVPPTGTVVAPSSTGAVGANKDGVAPRRSGGGEIPTPGVGDVMSSWGGSTPPGSSTTGRGRVGSTSPQLSELASSWRDRLPTGAAFEETPTRGGRVGSTVPPSLRSPIDGDLRRPEIGRGTLPALPTEEAPRGGQPLRGGVPADADVPVRGVRSTLPTGTTNHLGYVPPMVPPGAGGSEQTRRRPDYLLDDTDAFVDDRWLPSGVISADDVPPQTSR